MDRQEETSGCPLGPQPRTADPNMPSHINDQYQRLREHRSRVLTQEGERHTANQVSRSPSAREMIESELCELDRWTHYLRSLLPVAAAMEAGSAPDRALCRLLADRRVRA